MSMKPTAKPKLAMSKPDYKVKGGPVQKSTKSFTPGKKVKNIAGPDLSGGGWVK